MVGIRNGWDTTKPEDWSINEYCVYEENAYRMFQIYDRLCQSVGVLSKPLVSAGDTLLKWGA